MTYTYIKGLTTGPPISLLWLDGNGDTIDLSTGHTFVAAIVNHRAPELLLWTKTTGITGSNGSLGYNLLIDWETADFTPLVAGNGVSYDAIVIATPTVGDPFAFPTPIRFFLQDAPGGTPPVVPPVDLPLSLLLTADGNILTRTAGVPAQVTRTNLAADTAFTSRYLPQAHPIVAIDAISKSVDLVATVDRAVLRVERYQPSPLPPEWKHGLLIGSQGNIHMDTWMVISGGAHAAVDAEGNYWPQRAGGASKETMLSIWSDVPVAMEVRPYSLGTGHSIDVLDTAGNLRLAVEEDGSLSFGATTYAAVDTKVSRPGAGRLRVASVAAADAHLEINSPSGVPYLSLQRNGTTRFEIANSGTGQADFFVDGSLIMTLYRISSINRVGIGPNTLNVNAGLVVQAGHAAVYGARIMGFASQSLDILRIDKSDETNYHRFNKNGYSITAKVAAPADAELSAGELAMWFDSTNGASKAMFKAKQADGTVKTAAVALA